MRKSTGLWARAVVAAGIGVATTSASGQCPPEVVTYSDADFNGGAVILQQGFAEDEMAGAQYFADAGDFPLRIDLTEVLVAHDASVFTTTEWSLLFYAGPPDTGALIASYSSDGTLLPHIELGPGPNGVNLSFAIDPQDPQQIIIPANATNSFTVAFRIDKHNNQTQNPCFIAPPANSNAFPTTDTGGLSQPQRNWLFAVDCGIFGCAAGWNPFSSLGLCTPSGDWNIRVGYTPLTCGAGACCLSDGSCLPVSESDCSILGGTFQGVDTDCADANCPQPTQACCFEVSGGCSDFTVEDCLFLGGVPAGVGTSCATFTCFPEGACCLTDGSCVEGVSPDDCDTLGGVFQGDGTTCASSPCPEPEGACCLSDGGCFPLTEGTCDIVGGTWAGPGTNCDDDDGNGTADACEDDCLADWNGDGSVLTSDFIAYLNDYNTVLGGGTPVYGDPDLTAPIGVVNTSDFLAYLNAYVTGCP